MVFSYVQINLAFRLVDPGRVWLNLEESQSIDIYFKYFVSCYFTLNLQALLECKLTVSFLPSHSHTTNTNEVSK